MGRVSDERQKAVNQIFERIVTERQTTLDVLLSAEEPVRGVLADMNRTVVAANELTNSVNALASRFVPERPPGWQPPPSEPLDLEPIQAMLVNVTDTLEQVNGMIVSPHREERLPQLLQVIDRTEAEAEEMTDRLFLQTIALLAIFFVLLLTYRFVAARWIAKPDRA